MKVKIVQSCGGIIFLSGLVLDFDQQKNQSLEFQKFFRVVYTTKTSHYFTEFTLNMKMFMAMPRRAADIIVDGTWGTSSAKRRFLNLFANITTKDSIENPEKLDHSYVSFWKFLSMRVFFVVSDPKISFIYGSDP